MATQVPRPVFPTVKQKVSYPKAMTVCIAAACQDKGEPRIILCSDTRSSWGDITSNDTTAKMDVVGRGWCAQFANREDSARELIERLKEWFEKCVEVTTIHAVLSLIGKAVTEFKDSPLYEKDCCQLTVTGFVGARPVLVLISGDRKGELTVTSPANFASIGSGLTIANVFLTCRSYHSMWRLEEALYAVYEAKKFSEKAAGVGPVTILWVQAPGPSTGDRANLAGVSQDGIEALENVRRSIGLLPEVQIESLPEGFFDSSPVAPPHPQSTTDGQ